jgi:hypothetical protein
MAALTEEAVFPAKQAEQIEHSQIPSALPAVPPPAKTAGQSAQLFNYASMQTFARNAYQHCAWAAASLRESPAFRKSATLAATLPSRLATEIARQTKQLARHKYKNVPRFKIAGNKSRLKDTRFKASWERASRYKVTWSKNRSNWALAGISAVLVLACWIAYKDRAPASAVGTSAALSRTAVENPVPSQPAKPNAAKKAALTPLTMPVPTHEPTPARTTGRRVRVGANEVDYVRGDVTVRYFTDKPVAQRKTVAKSRVSHIGDDVTVHYFAPAAASHAVSQ